MIRPAVLLWAVLVVAAGLLLYKVKHDVRELEEELAGLNRAIQERRDRIHVLEAEWSLLNEPERLRDLAARHLALAPLRADQLARASEAVPRLAFAPARALPTADPPPALAQPAPAEGAAQPSAVASLPLPPAFPEVVPQASPAAAVTDRRGNPSPSPAAPPRQPAAAETPAARPAPRPAVAPARARGRQRHTRSRLSSALAGPPRAARPAPRPRLCPRHTGGKPAAPCPGTEPVSGTKASPRSAAPPVAVAYGRPLVPLARDRPKRHPLEVARARLAFGAGAFALLYLALAGRLIDAATAEPGRFRAQPVPTALVAPEPRVERAAIVDRNGVVLAMSLPSAGLYANPREIIDPEETARRLAGVLPGLDPAALAPRLTGERQFVWIRRHLTPREQQAVIALGLPGLHFQRAERRVYPQGRAAVHVLGGTDVDGNGIAGRREVLRCPPAREPCRAVAPRHRRARAACAARGARARDRAVRGDRRCRRGARRFLGRGAGDGLPA
ncbi:MAG: hypothetical protein RML45_15240 [Acetobacteraceae bacterium]|nr:hypothetical protein [Acetobacteraceae bacterium]